jgi:hypothetical protein
MRWTDVACTEVQLDTAVAKGYITEEVKQDHENAEKRSKSVIFNAQIKLTPCLAGFLYCQTEG